MCNEDNRYADMLAMPHHRSVRHPHMSMMERAAQFSPFAALTGYGDEIRETERLTESRRVMTEDAAEELNRRLTVLKEREAEHPEILLLHFVPDLRKEGGSYVRERVGLKRVELNGECLLLMDGREILFRNLVPEEDWFAED